MSKIILTADLHFKDGLYLQVGLDYLDYLFDYCYKNKIDKVAILGDLLDKAYKIRNEVFISLFKKIEQARDNGIEFYFLLGNHDITSTLTNSSLLETFERFGHLINSPQTFDFDGVSINMVPYTKDENLVLTVGADYLFTHLAISEFDYGGGRISEEAESFPISLFSNYKKVFTGHFHKRQEKQNIQYIGSPYQLNFGDMGDTNKGFVVFDIETGKEEFIKYTMAPKFIKFTYDELWNKLDKSELKEGSLSNCLVKVIVDKKVDKLSKLKTILYNYCGAIDIINEFENKKEDDNTDEIKVEMNISINNMIRDFISETKIQSEFDISNSELLEKFDELKGELA